MNINDYLSEKTFELKDAYCGKPVAYFKIPTSKIPDELINKNFDRMYFSQANQAWLYIDRKVTREECIKLYGEITDEEFGPRGGWKTVTFGTTKFKHEFLKPVK